MIAGVLVIASLAGLWRLNQGPVSLSALEPYLSWPLSSGPDALTLTVTNPALTWGGLRRPVDLKAGPVIITDTRGRPVVEVEQVSVGLAWLDLLRRNVSLSWIEVQSTHVQLLRTEDGQLVVGFESSGQRKQKTAKESDAAFQELLRDTLTSPEPHPRLRRLTRVSITGSRATVDDRKMGRVWGVPKLDLHLERSGSDLRFSMDGTVDLEVQETALSVRGFYEREEQRLKPEISVKALRLSSIAQFIPAVRQLESIDMPMDVELSADISIDGEIGSAELKLDSPLGIIEGELTARPDGSPTVQLALTGFQPWRLSGLVPDLDRVRIPVSVRAEADLTPEWAPKNARLTVDGEAGTVAAPEIHARPFDVEDLSLQFTIDDGLTAARLSDLRLQLPGLTVTADATATRGDTTTRISANAYLSDLDAAAIDRYWPSELVPDVLQWISTNITAGTVREATVHTELSMPAGAASPIRLADLHGSFRFDDLTVAYLAPMPPATGVTGTATFTDEGFDFDVSAGRVIDLMVSTADVAIAPLSGFTRLSVDARDVTGPVTTALAAIAGPPLELLGPELPQPDQFSGSAVTRLVLGVPLSGADPVGTAASGSSRLSMVGLDGWLGGYRLSESDLDLEFDLENLDVGGTTRVNGVPVEFTWHEDLTGGTVARTIVMTTTLDDAGREAVGVPPLSQISGPVDLAGDLTGHADGSMSLAVEGNLTETSLAVSQMGWSKAAGVEGRFTANLVIGPDWGVTVDPLRIAAGDLWGYGSFAVSPGFDSLERLDVGNLRFGENQIAGHLAHRPDESWELSLTGRRFDIGPLIKPTETNQDEEPPEASAASSSGFDLPPFSAEISIDELIAGEEHRLGRFSGSGRFDGSVWVSLTTDLQVAPGNVLEIRVRKAETGGHDLSVTAADAGEVLSALLPRAELTGGALQINGHRANSDAALEGTFRLEDYVVTESTALTRLLQVASIGGALDALAGEGISFKTLQSNFSVKNRKITLRRFRTTGSSLGITSDGWVDVSTGTMDVKGAVVPASRIQQILGKIPGLGVILTGTRGEGLIAVNYRAHGPTTTPQLDVNPLSGLTPGILRDMFRITDPVESSGTKAPN